MVFPNKKDESSKAPYKREELAEVFRDTQLFYHKNRLLREAIETSSEQTSFYPEDDYPTISSAADKQGTVSLSKSKTFEAAVAFHKQFPDKKIAVLNFASAVIPGGGVKSGATAQEESLCRCSTLYPVLDREKLWDVYYNVNRELSDPLHTDAIIYSPEIVICKTDDYIPRRLPENEFVSVDVITCAAPNLRIKPSNAYNPDTGDTVHISPEELYDLHLKRAKHILHIAAVNGVDILILGAFGCGAFRNDPNVVAKAYSDAVKDYSKYFDQIDFAIYCREFETENYNAFSRYF